MRKKKNNKPTGIVKCYACYVGIPINDYDDPDGVILRHRLTTCSFAYPKFPRETQDIKKEWKIREKKNSKKKPKNKKKKSWYKKNKKKKQGTK